MPSAEQCLKNAERCERYARCCVLPQERKAFEDMAAAERRRAEALGEPGANRSEGGRRGRLC